MDNLDNKDDDNDDLYFLFLIAPVLLLLCLLCVGLMMIKRRNKNRVDNAFIDEDVVASFDNPMYSERANITFNLDNEDKNELYESHI